MTGCGTEHISERIYTRTLGITSDPELTMYAQAFGKDDSFSGTGRSAAAAIRSSESAQGGSIFIGHTELLCVDGSSTLAQVQDLLFSQGLSPACKLLYTDVRDCFASADTTALLESIRMAERNGALAVTDISTVLNEWLGDKQTALLPSLSGGALQMVLLHTDGTCTMLTAEAASGMYWLRRHGGEDFTITVETEDGVQDVPILRSALKKSAKEDRLCYALTVYTDDCPENVRPALQEMILRQCHTAVTEMLAADADVIGLGDLAEFSRLDIGESSPDISVVIR